MSLMGSDGSLVPWVVPPRGEYNANYLLTFYSGEAVLALAEFARVDSNQAALHAAERAEAYYMDRYATHIATNFFPPYVPWHTMALAELYGITGKAPYATAAFVMNDALLTIQDTAVYVGRFYDREHPEYGEPRAASDGLYTEGMAYAYEMGARARRYGSRTPIPPRDSIRRNQSAVLANSDPRFDQPGQGRCDGRCIASERR